MSCDLTEVHLVTAINKIMNDLKKNKKLCNSVSIEVMVHPGYVSAIGDGGCGEGPDCFSLSKDREFEVDALTSKWFRDIISFSECNMISSL